MRCHQDIQKYENQRNGQEYAPYPEEFHKINKTADKMVKKPGIQKEKQYADNKPIPLQTLFLPQNCQAVKNASQKFHLT